MTVHAPLLAVHGVHPQILPGLPEEWESVGTDPPDYRCSRPEGMGECLCVRYAHNGHIAGKGMT